LSSIRTEREKKREGENGQSVKNGQMMKSNYKMFQQAEPPATIVKGFRAATGSGDNFISLLRLGGRKGEKKPEKKLARKYLLTCLTSHST
jgi:hypothetical protein